MTTALPEDTHLAYIVSHEAWYARTPGVIDHPEINVMASAKGSGGGVAWEFMVEEVDLGRGEPAIRVKVFDDAFAAFAQIPEFFAAIAETPPQTLKAVRAALDAMGAVDETERHGPHGEAPAVVTSGRIRKAITDATNADDATAAVLRVLGAERDPR